MKQEIELETYLLGEIINKSQQGYNHIETGRAELKIEDFSIWKAIFNKTYKAKDVVLTDPNITVVFAPKKDKKSKKKKKIDIAAAEAHANKLKEQSLTPLLIQQQWINQWDGKLPVYTGNSGPLPFIEVK